MSRRRFLHQGVALLASLPGALTQQAMAEIPGTNATGRFRFAVLGDTLDRQHGVEDLSVLLAGIGETDARFILDVGSFKSDEEKCTDGLFGERVALLNASTTPLIAVAADNEWLGCAQPRQGGFDPVERLEQLRQTMFQGPQSLGTVPMPLARQNAMRQFHTFSENARWQSGRVLFITLDAPAPNNDFRFAAGRNGEFEDRVIANRVWLERAFRSASMLRLAAIVVALQGDPEFARPLRAPDHRVSRRDGFYELKNALREETARFHGQVLLIHGASSGFLIDQPLLDASGRVLKNFTRVRAIAPPNGTRWLEVEVDARSPRVFAVQTRELPTVPAA